jgi:predicted ATP-dependent endonuclease of OLD family
MQIRKMKVGNFKSLLNFELNMNKFTCLIGLNGAGKSTVLQFIDFLVQQLSGNITGWLEDHQWQHSELSFKEFTLPLIHTREDVTSTKTQFLSNIQTEIKKVPITETPISQKYIDFYIEIIDGEDIYSWYGLFDITYLRCITEHISTPKCVLKVEQDRFSIIAQYSGSAKTEHSLIDSLPITFAYEGSILSQLKPELIPDEIKNFANFIKNIHPLGLLTPEALCKQSHKYTGSVDVGGKQLSAFLHELGDNLQSELVKKLNRIYPQLSSIKTKLLYSGHKLLEIQENFDGQFLVTEARHVNDGMLRIIAILAELQSKAAFLLLDEIENGINPEAIEFLIDILLDAPQQVMVTTHSPLILNYLEDDVALDSVVYIYKTSLGHTKAIPFFAIQSLNKKLQIMGPGEVFADTDLTHLIEEIHAMNLES